MICYTQKEMTEKKWTTDDVCKVALVIIKEKTNGQLTQICTDTLKNVSDTELLTVERLNKLVDGVIADTFYYDGYKIK